MADSNSNFEVFANLATGSGDIKATANHRIIISQHQFYRPQYTAVQYKDQTLLTFPNKEMPAADSSAATKLDSVLHIISYSNAV
ncbi:hypothetical protein [Methylomonas sp. DH-1]|uniref:hypothetical protein n=1 Tax=Methylomonas sp. (strain DH-1) TaxID=1727196 RepID=UPI0007C92ED6|nr:hypothetical protein [Methylomonas sp. DH-1]ANE55803.1 hypothetical protein AYM39_11825 [Methylomonas sp. DH-1]